MWKILNDRGSKEKKKLYEYIECQKFYFEENEPFSLLITLLVSFYTFWAQPVIHPLG